MAFNLVLNSNNAVAGTNNTSFQFNFIKSNIEILDDSEICISSIQIPYSWFNITSAYQNQSFAILFPTSTSQNQLFSVTLSPGFYTVTDINAAIQQFCIANGLYLINSSGLYVYYLVLLYNTTTYGVQLITTLVPTSLPTGWTQPGNWIGYNSNSYCPQLVVQNNFGIVIGFSPGTYPANQLTNGSTLNSQTPLGSNVNSLIVRCSLVDNQVGVPTDILDSFPITATFGSNINYQPPSLKWIRIVPGTFQSLLIKFVDQNLNSIVALDNNVCISLLIKNKGKRESKFILPFKT